ncbi:MAG: NRAMP family divalent metal transporter [Solirubrobacterales bacterium]
MKFLRKFFKKFGPGFITGASDDDPSGIVTYSQTGALFGYSLLWLTPFSFPFVMAIQEMCGRIGLVTGKGLSAILKKHYPKWVLFIAVTLLFTANTVNIAADLGAMAASAQMVFGLSFTFWIFFISCLIIFLEIFISYNSYSRVLKFFALCLFAYFITAFMVKQDWNLIIKSIVIPDIKLTKDYLLNIVAFLGTTISPYLFFWQASEEVEEKIIKHRYNADKAKHPTVRESEIKDLRIDTAFGMIFSQTAAFMIVITTAATLHLNGITQIETAPQAALALKPFAGDMAYLVFAMGVIGLGMLGVPVLAGSSAYGVSEALGWKEGLGKKLWEAPLFYSIIALSTLIGLAMNFIGINPMRALYYAAAVNGLLAPPLMFIILFIGINKKIMGSHINGRLSTVLNFLGALLMTGAAFMLLINL